MGDAELLKILKTDLQISSPALDSYLRNLINAARSYIRQEGINLGIGIDDMLLVEMYAAYLYRQRREGTQAMPRALRYALNNRLFSEKGGEKRDG